MSEDILQLIPTVPAYVPSETSRFLARQRLASWFPDAEKIADHVTEDVEFIDPGTNLERILCPACGKELAILWWHEAMDRAFQEGHVAHLSVVVPCCGITHSLNDLCYEWPAGFARFVLEIRDPGYDLSEEHVHLLEQDLQCTLRTIWAHY